MHDSEGSCEKFTLSLFIFRVKKLVMHSERFMKNRSAINYTSSYKLLSSLSSSIIILFPRPVCNVCHPHHVCSEVHFCRRVFCSDIFFLHGQLVDSVILSHSHPTVSRVNVELVRHFLAGSWKVQLPVFHLFLT